MKKIMVTLAALSLAAAAHALSLSVTNVRIAQRYPWNGLVDIDYTIECDDATANIWVYPVGYDADFNTSVAPRTLTGDGVNGQPVKAGSHRMTWNMAADMPENYNRAKFSMKIYAYAGAAPYMVVDLSAGPEAEKYEVSYLTEIPNGEWDAEYKTSKLVLKLVAPGTFLMGSPEDELGHNWGNSKEPLHTVTLTQPFYMGVFEVTQRQYELVMGSNPSQYKGEERPVERVSYDMLRGATLGAQWPSYKQVDASSFFGKIRARTGITFDLPTEAQWEYTCRAGTGTALNSGKNLTGTDTCVNMAEVGRYRGNRNDGKGEYSEHTAVGKYLPNAWGFYDMHGNVAEWCRDWWSANLENETDPKGPVSGTYRVTRGGSYYDSARYSGVAAGCRSASRVYTHDPQTYATRPNQYESFWGFRLAAYPAE